jgi:hypothetical protein
MDVTAASKAVITREMSVPVSHMSVPWWVAATLLSVPLSAPVLGQRPFRRDKNPEYTPVVLLPPPSTPHDQLDRRVAVDAADVRQLAIGQPLSVFSAVHDAVGARVMPLSVPCVANGRSDGFTLALSTDPSTLSADSIHNEWSPASHFNGLALASSGSTQRRRLPIVGQMQVCVPFTGWSGRVAGIHGDCTR